MKLASKAPLTALRGRAPTPVEPGRSTGAAAAACPLGRRCPAERTLDVIGGRWKVPILWHLLQGTLRFSELRRALPGVTQKMLTQQLRELERAGVVRRRVYPQVPPKVEYSLTDRGQTLKPVVDAMCKWGKA
jgi:DNA-binding HxlR family transcriptional regulator